MNSKAYFKETQKFAQAWIWLLLATITIVILSFYFFSFEKDTSFAEVLNSESLMAIFISAIAFSLVFILWKIMKLEVIIESDVIKFRYTPFIYKYKTIHRSEIESYKVHEYKPLKEYGGWGYRQGKKGKTAYNVKGNIGLEIFMTNGTVILLGTQRKEAIERAMRQMIGEK